MSELIVLIALGLGFAIGYFSKGISIGIYQPIREVEIKPEDKEPIGYNTDKKNEEPAYTTDDITRAVQSALGVVLNAENK